MDSFRPDIRRLLILWMLILLPVRGLAVDRLAPVWVFPETGAIGPVQSSPTVFRNIVYVGSDDGRLYALHATGSEAGRLVKGFPVPVDGAIRGRPAVYGLPQDERIYVATTRGTLYAFRLDGTPVWSQAVAAGVPIVSTPAVRGPFVYVTASNGRVYRRHLRDGSDAGGLTYGRAVSTRLMATQRLVPAPRYLEVAEARGFFASGRIRVQAAGPLGQLVDLEFTYRGKTTATKPHRLLNVAQVGASEAVLSLPAGSRVFGYGPGAAANASPAVPGADESTLVIAALESAGSAVDSGGGNARNIVGLRSEYAGLVPQWEMGYGERISGSLAVDEVTGALFFGAWESETDPSKGSRLYCVHASNGLPDSAWNNQGYVQIAGSVLQGGPWLDRNGRRLFFGTTNGTLYGLKMQDGSEAFRPTTLDGLAGAFQATPLMVGDTLYIGSRSGRFYAVSASQPRRYSVYAMAEGQPLVSSPSASGTRVGSDVVVVGSMAGKVLAFPLVDE